MRNKYTLLALLVLTACASGTKLHEAKTIEPIGTEFQKTLYQEYINQAENENISGYSDDVDFYANRAIAVGSGKTVQFYQVDENGIPSETVPLFRKAKARFNTALNNGARKQTPYRAARAQVAYDCWWTEVVDNGLTQRARVCRDKFRYNMTEIEEIINKDKPQ